MRLIEARTVVITCLRQPEVLFIQETGFFTLTEVSVSGPLAYLSPGILRGHVLCLLYWSGQGIRASATELTASGHLGFDRLFFYTWTVMVRRLPSLRLWRDYNVAVWCSTDLQGGHRSSPGSAPRKELRNPSTLLGPRNSNQAGASGYGTTVTVGSTGHRNPTVQDLREGSPELGSMFSVYWVKIRQDFDDV